MVYSFGTSQSTIVFVYNDEPIATRYHFESDASKFLPTITFENGPIEIEIMWQNAMEPGFTPAFLKENKINWIKPPNDCCEMTNESQFENLQKIEDMPVQSVVPLSKTFPHYKCIQMEVSNDGQGASVGIASCSPLKPTPTCSLLRDYYTWLPKMKRKLISYLLSMIKYA